MKLSNKQITIVLLIPIIFFLVNIKEQGVFIGSCLLFIALSAMTDINNKFRSRE